MSGILCLKLNACNAMHESTPDSIDTNEREASIISSITANNPATPGALNVSVLRTEIGLLLTPPSRVLFSPDESELGDGYDSDHQIELFLQTGVEDEALVGHSQKYTYPDYMRTDYTENTCMT